MHWESRGASLFVPEGFRPGPEGSIDVLLHLHGAASVVEPAFVRAGWPGVLVTFNRKGLSSVYTQPFRDHDLLPDLHGRALATLDVAKLADDPKPGRLVVSTFSAGFGGLREMLRDPAHASRIDAAILADSLYCGYAGDAAERRVDPDLMAPFLAFARLAAAGKKALLVTHSAQVPDGYASTTETADTLIAAVNAVPGPIPEAFAPERAPARRLLRGKFEVLGFPGAGAEDHLRHLREIAAVWSEARRVMGR